MNTSVYQHAAVFANGDADAETLALLPDLSRSLIVAVDGGYRHCQALDVTPHWLVGDLDSMPEGSVPSATQVERFPVEKDATDLELALLKLEQEGIQSVTLAGIDGGRLDHALTNLLLIGARAWSYRLNLVFRGGYGAVIDARSDFHGPNLKGHTISLIALSPSVLGVCTTGLYYPLTDAQLDMGSTLGMSNVVSANDFSVSVTQGRVLVLINVQPAAINGKQK